MNVEQSPRQSIGWCRFDLLFFLSEDRLHYQSQCFMVHHIDIAFERYAPPLPLLDHINTLLVKLP